MKVSGVLAFKLFILVQAKSYLGDHGAFRSQTNTHTIGDTKTNN